MCFVVTCVVVRCWPPIDASLAAAKYEPSEAVDNIDPPEQPMCAGRAQEARHINTILTDMSCPICSKGQTC